MKPSLLLSFLFLTGLSALGAQPRLLAGLTGGYYEPTLTGFDTNAEIPTPKFMAKNVLYGLSLEGQVFYNTRITYQGLNSRHSGKTVSGANFSRTLTYRLLSLQTFYWPWRRLELNFSLGAVIGRGVINLNTKNASTDWDALLSSYGNSSIPLSSSDNMTTWWLGYASSIGLRYYLRSWLGLDLKAGFMHNGYRSSAWKFQGKTVTGPSLSLKRLPLFSLQVIFGW
ncbi:MAG: hypothetical protein GXO90_03200 [FCB group bacterium]|nr:hypothetical protein [FCB group bacterium]